MFKTKLDVDKHVENCLKKINAESERNLRCFAFAKLYFKVGDYEQARRYIAVYLNIKSDCAEAHQLRGRILEKLGKVEAALEAYRTSLDLDPKQNKLVLKVCELLALDNINFDQSGARYYCEKAQTIDPNNPSLFSLKEKLVLLQGNDPTVFLLKEIEERPNDIAIQVRLLRHLLQNNQIEEAYNHARNFEQRKSLTFVKNVNWYEIIAEVLLKYQHDTLKQKLNWEFWIILISVLDKLVDLSLDEHRASVKSHSEYTYNLFNLDQTLKVASEQLKECPDKNLAQEFLNHYRGQLCFHFITLIYKQAKKDLLKYKEATQITLPLLFAAYHSRPIDLQSLWVAHSTENKKQLVQRWNREGSFRCSQTGHMLLCISKDRKNTVLEKAAQCSSGLWREQLLKRVFVARDYQSKFKTSFFATCNQLVELVIRLPEIDDLTKYDDVAQLVYPDSLHHFIWIGLNRTLPNFKCSAFEGLPYTTKNLNNCSAESLNILDIHAFLYCAILCAQHQIEEQKHNIYYPTDKPLILPAAITNQLGTLNQSKWLASAYKMFKNDCSCDFNEIRLTLIKGIETVRCIGNHGVDVKMLVMLAKIFTDRSKTLEKTAEIEQNNDRAELYWRTALPLLEKLKNNQIISYSANRLFEYKTKELSLSDIQSFIDDGKLFNAVRFMKKKEHEKALMLFETLKDPYASFFQAQIYKMKAEEQTSRNKENVTSEMRSQNIILLSKARDCLYLTFDRLRDPSVDRKHPLNCQLGTEIDKIERMLSRIDPDTYLNRNECDGMSDENMSSLGSMGDHFNYGNSSFFNGNVTPKNDHLNSTPLRLDTSRREARPSPERLDAQLKQLLASRDTHVLELNKFMMDSHRALLDEIRGFKDAVNNLTSAVDEIKGFKSTINEIKGLQGSVDELKNSVDDLKSVTDDVLKMKKEIAELKKDALKIKSNQISDEDLYGLEEEYTNDYGAGMNSNVAGLPSNLYPTLSRLPSANSLQYGPALYHSMYPMMHYPGLGLPQPGSLPFVPENQLTDFRSINNLSQNLGAPSTYLQPSFSQTALAQGSLSQGLTHGGLAQTVLQPTGLSHNVIPPTCLGHSPHPNLGTGQTLASNSALFPSISSTTISNQTLFSVSTSTLPTTSVASTIPSSFLLNSLSTSKALPVNVVITSSDPLPPTKSTPQPILSVTIPPQHLKANQSKVKPHNYQIHLPASTTTTNIVSEAPIPISQSLLNLSSTISLQSDPQLKGAAIEKPFNQSFNNGNSKTELNKSNVSTNSIDHDPCPDFKPIIPLPDEVPVNTGEENETILFEERAKLFRYHNKEWRERGVGLLKLLKDETTGKVRILMRRDQVHKICANHFLTKDMVLTPMINNEKAYVWAANDFADQEIVLEKLCVRFKTPEIAQSFFKAFENSKINLPDPGSTVTELEGAKNDTDNRKLNSAGAETEATQLASFGGFVFTSTPTFKPKTTASASIEETPKEVIKLSPFATFTFAKPPTTIPSTIAFSPVINDFKTVHSNSENVLNVTPQRIESVSSTTIENTSEYDEDYEPPVDFKPIISLPELVEVKTGEENADVFFEQKAKLLRYDASSKQWKERGIGQMKILKFDNAIRLIMRREQVHKVCCNHQLLKSMCFSYMPKNGKALCWYAQDFSDGIITPEMFAIKFKTEDQAKLFHNVIVSCQASIDDSFITNQGETSDKTNNETRNIDKKVKGDNEPRRTEVSPTPKQGGWGDKYKPKSGSWECKNCYVINEGKITLCIACGTPKNENIAKKESNSGPQFSFGVRNPNSTNSESNFVQTADAENITNHETKSNWGDLFKAPLDSWECKICCVRNTKDKSYCISCDSPKDDKVPAKKDNSKSVNLDTPGLSFTFGIPTTTSTTITTNATVPLTFGSPVTKGSTTFPFGNDLSGNKPFTFTVKSDNKVDTTDDNRFIFGSPQKHTFDFIPRSPRRHSSSHTEEESEGSYLDEEEDNIYFKPVIALPEKVEVKTGEEQEVILYCHRAKLFRFADGEWKERGIGDIKILRKSDTGKLRILMRREQILKICLNHILTKEITYSPKDDKTWLFSAPDYSEGEIQHRQFCIRFKSSKVAQDFKKAIESALCADIKLEDSDVEIISETKVTLEEEEEAKRLGLPPKFMSYRQLNDCTCDECKKDDILLKEILFDHTSGNQNLLQKSFNETPVSFVDSTTQNNLLIKTPKTNANINTSAMETFAKGQGDTKDKETTTLKQLLAQPALLKITEAKTSSKPTPMIFSTALVNTTVNKSLPTKTSNEMNVPTTNDNISNFSFSLKSVEQGLPAFTNIDSNKSIPTPSTSESILNTSTSSISDRLNSGNFGSIFGSTNTTKIFGNAPNSGHIFGGNFSSFGTNLTFGISKNDASTAVNTFATDKTNVLGSTSNTSVNENTFSFASNIAPGDMIKTKNPLVSDMQAKNQCNLSQPALSATEFGNTKIDAVSMFGNSQSKPILANTSAIRSLGSLTFETSLGCSANSTNSKENKVDDFLKCDPNLNFASLAKESGDAIPFSKDVGDKEQVSFAFLGAGAPVFGTKSVDKNKKVEGHSQDADVTIEDEYDPHYEPIVPLPEAVVVSTGEEDETILFNERAKLYRYDVNLKEWKERGVGQLKILYHPTNHTYRILLRREQVHKLVLNQLITTDLDLQSMVTTDKAWCWGAYNYSEDEHSLEKLSARFKNVDQKKNFFDTVQSCIEAIKEYQSTQSFIPSTLEECVRDNISGDDERDTAEEVEGDTEEDGDYYDDDEEDDRAVMFKEKCKLSEKISEEWKTISSGVITIFYDSELYGTRITFSDDCNILSNTLIAVNTVMDLNENVCTWRAVEWANNVYQWRNLRATFDTNDAAELFHLTYQEGVSYAEQSDIIDSIPTYIDPE